MHLEGEFLIFTPVEISNWGVKPKEPVDRAPDIHALLEKRYLDTFGHITEARMSPNWSSKGQALDLSLEANHVHQTVQQLWNIMIDRGIVGPQDEIRAFMQRGQQPSSNQE